MPFGAGSRGDWQNSAGKGCRCWMLMVMVLVVVGEYPFDKAWAIIYSVVVWS